MKRYEIALTGVSFYSPYLDLIISNENLWNLLHANYLN